MRDLSVLKKVIGKLNGLTEETAIEVIDRAIAAESELETLRAERKAMMEQEPVGEFSGAFSFKGGKSYFEAKCFDALPAVGAKLYAQPIPVQIEIAEPGEWGHGEDNDGWYVERNENQVCYCASEENARYMAERMNAQPSPSAAVHDGWNKNVMRLWSCVRKHDSTIPDSQLDRMRDLLLSTPTSPSAEQDEKSDSGKAKNWDYYQELLKLNGFSGITDLLTKFHEIERSAEKPNSADTNVLEDVQQLAFEYGHNEDGSGYILGNEEFDKCIELAIKLAAEKQQRITEQDAAEIAHSALKFWRNTVNLTLQSWLNGECDPLLAKLNEHREPDCKAQRDLLLAAAKEIFRPAQSVSNIAFNLGQHHKEWDNSIYPSIKELDAARSKLSAAIAQCEGKGNV